MAAEGIQAWDVHSITTVCLIHGTRTKLIKRDEVERYVECSGNHRDAIYRGGWNYERPIYSDRWDDAAARRSRICNHSDITRVKLEVKDVEERITEIDKELPQLERELGN